MNQKEFAVYVKSMLEDGFEKELGDFSTYLLENVAACKQSGGSDLFTREEATNIMAYVQELSNSTGGNKSETLTDIHLAFPELIEMLGILHTLKHAMANDAKINPGMVMRHFYLTGRVMNFLHGQIEEAGV